MSLSLIVVGKRGSELGEFSERNPAVSLHASEVVLLNNERMRYGGQGAIWNRATAQRPAVNQVVGLVHADTLLSPAFLANAEAAAKRGFVVGLVGRDLEDRYVWAHQIGQITPVSTLDGCSLFVSVETVLQFNLSMDTETFDSFHCSVEDFCLQAQVCANVESVVVPGMAGHEGKSTFDDAWRREYAKYRMRLQVKYADTIFKTT